MKKLLSLVFASFIAISFSMSLATAKTLRIGSMGPLTGPYAADGNDIKHGVEVAIDVINEQGGIPGYETIEFYPTDTACDPKQAVAGANKLVNQKVQGVIGAYCSSSTIPASEVLADEDIIMLTPASTHPDVTDRGLTYMFRLAGRDDAQAPAAGEFLKALGIKSIFLVDDKTTYSQGLADGVEASAKALGIKVLGHEHVNEGDKDFSAVLTKAKSLGADAFGMYLQNWASATTMSIQAKRIGLKGMILAGDSTFHPKFPEIAKSAAENIYVTFSFISEETPEYRTFQKRWKAKYDQDKIGGYGSYAYDAAMSYLLAVKNAGTADPAKVKTEIMKLDFQGVTKQVKFLPNGDSGSAYIVFKIVNGDYVPYWSPIEGML